MPITETAAKIAKNAATLEEAPFSCATEGGVIELSSAGASCSVAGVKFSFKLSIVYSPLGYF